MGTDTTTTVIVEKGNFSSGPGSSVGDEGSGSAGGRKGFWKRLSGLFGECDLDNSGSRNRSFDHDGKDDRSSEDRGIDVWSPMAPKTDMREGDGEAYVSRLTSDGRPIRDLATLVRERREQFLMAERERERNGRQTSL